MIEFRINPRTLKKMIRNDVDFEVSLIEARQGVRCVESVHEVLTLKQILDYISERSQYQKLTWYGYVYDDELNLLPSWLLILRYCNIHDMTWFKDGNCKKCQSI